MSYANPKLMKAGKNQTGTFKGKPASSRFQKPQNPPRATHTPYLFLCLPIGSTDRKQIAGG